MAKKYYYSLFNKQVDSSAESSDSFYFVEQTTSSDGEGNSLFIQFEVEALIDILFTKILNILYTCYF